MGQLSPAAESAREIVAWLLDKDGYHDDGRPIGSVRALVSDLGVAQGGHVNHPTRGKIDVPGATLDNVEQAITEWAGSLKEGDLALFFFSGHGVAAGFDQALLLSDFGDASTLNETKPAIKFNHFYQGMDRVAAREQCFFIDACRSYSEAFALTHGAAGEAIVRPGKKPPGIQPRRAPVFNATLEGELAYGIVGEASLFTEALLQALKGGGCDNTEDDAVWKVETNQLNRSIEFILKRISELKQLDQAQVNSGQAMTSVSLGTLPHSPVIPVAFNCQPEEATGLAEFHLPQAIWRTGQPDPLIPFGTYQFLAKFADASFSAGQVEKEIRPPFRIVKIPVVAGQS